MPAPAGQSCENCLFVVEKGTSPNFYYECHYDPSTQSRETNTWRHVEPSEWCGKWKVEGSDLANQYLSNTMSFGVVGPVPILTRAGPPQFNRIALVSCQVANSSTNDDVIVSFLDGNDPAQELGFIGCHSKDQRSYKFDPPLLARVGNDIYALLSANIEPAYMYISVQGFMIAG